MPCLTLTLSLLAALGQPEVRTAPPTPRVSNPQFVPQAKPPKWSKRPGSGMITGGAIMLGVSYLFTSMAGAMRIDEARDASIDDPSTVEIESGIDHRQRTFGYRLLIPVVGPFWAAPKARKALGAWGAVTMGVMQLGGAALMFAGGTRYARWKRERGFALGASSDGRSASLVLRGRF